MFKLDFNHPLLDLEGRQVVEDDRPISLKFALAFAMAQRQERGDNVRFYDYVVQLQKDGILIVQNDEKRKLIDFIDNSLNLTALSKGQLIRIIDKAPEVELKHEDGKPTTVVPVEKEK
jgi:hypothetical protein